MGSADPTNPLSLGKASPALSHSHPRSSLRTAHACFQLALLRHFAARLDFQSRHAENDHVMIMICPIYVPHFLREKADGKSEQTR